MESDLLLDHHQKPLNSGLTRYSSAPSSYFSSFIDKELNEFLNRPSSPETENIFARFLSSDDNFTATAAVVRRSSAAEVEKNQIIESMNEEKPVIQQINFSSNPDSGSGPVMGYRPPVNSVGIDRALPMKTVGGNNSSLIRHSSSPADIFVYINVDSGYNLTRGMDGYGDGTKTNKEASGKPPISAGQISEIGNKNIPMPPWDDSSILPDDIDVVKPEKRKFSGLNTSDTKISPRPPPLVHHMSLPANPSGELSAIENFLQYSDSGPCKIRAKRGMATHPRSIAERVRRTKISERMRKLQELVPNMDKQTNTSDMLDLAVDYIKELQRQHKILSDNNTKCTCSSKKQKL